MRSRTSPTRAIRTFCLFLVSIIVLWSGCNNAAKEIVKEEAIYGRERAVNLGFARTWRASFWC